MAALLKFKLLATQCATARCSSTAPPSSSAGSCIHGLRLRRRRKSYSAVEPSDHPERRGTLRDLLVSSPPPSPERCDSEGIERCDRGEGNAGWRRLGVDLLAGGGRPEFMRFGSRGLRHRLLRLTWRPVLVTIPE